MNGFGNLGGLIIGHKSDRLYDPFEQILNQTGSSIIRILVLSGSDKHPTSSPDKCPS